MEFKRTTLVAACLVLCVCQTFEPFEAHSHTHVQIGVASWYGKQHQGRKTANGERFDMTAETAAHRSLPFNTLVKVTRLETGQSTLVRINDRGPMVPGRIIDLSEAAATALGMHEDGIAKVRLEIVSAEP